MKRQGYKFGVAWIAENDNAGMGDDVHTIAAYVSTLLLADLFGKQAGDVAEDIHRYRRANKIGPNPYRVTHGMKNGTDWYFVLDATGQTVFDSHSQSVCEDWVQNA